MGNNLLYQLDSVEFEFVMRNFFGNIVKFIYNLGGKCVDMLYEYIAKNRFGLDDQVARITSSISMILLIFMIFRLTIKLLNYIIDPDSVFDKGVGFTSLIKKVIIGIILLVSITPMFNLLYKINDDIIDSDIINSIVLGDEKRGKIITTKKDKDGNEVIDEFYYYPIRASYLCPDNFSIIARSKGDALAIQALLPFYNITNPDDIQSANIRQNLENDIAAGAGGYCGWQFNDAKDIGNDIVVANSKEEIEKITVKKYSAETISKASKTISWFMPGNLKVGYWITSAIASHIENDAKQEEQETLGFTASDINSLVSPNVYLNSIDSTGSIITRVAANLAGPLGVPVKLIMDAFRNSDSWFTVDFHYFWATIFGIIFMLLVISFCFDAVIRALTLFFYQVIAPVPIILYMSPIKKDNEVLFNWIKKFDVDNENSH